ncbi:hypothetical protein CDD83_7230 [Cordyceps sp. RAO-2017]|nr:hypothetical protein CDD83_7230 [Cordyceps sp. RAO-2017]
MAIAVQVKAPLAVGIPGKWKAGAKLLFGQKQGLERLAVHLVYYTLQQCLDRATYITPAVAQVPSREALTGRFGEWKFSALHRPAQRSKQDERTGCTGHPDASRRVVNCWSATTAR